MEVKNFINKLKEIFNKPENQENIKDALIKWIEESYEFSVKVAATGSIYYIIY